LDWIFYITSSLYCGVPSKSLLLVLVYTVGSSLEGQQFVCIFIYYLEPCSKNKNSDLADQFSSQEKCVIGPAYNLMQP